MFRRLFLSQWYLAQALWVLILLARLLAVSFFLLRFLTSLSIQGRELMSRIMRRGTNVFNVSSNLETQLSQLRLMSGIPTESLTMPIRLIKITKFEPKPHCLFDEPSHCMLVVICLNVSCGNAPVLFQSIPQQHSL